MVARDCFQRRRMSDSFYRAFEEKYRGSRELIKTRLRVYLPFVQPLLKAYPAGKTLDVGCGRGEWLELMGEQGFEVVGVDLNDGMLQACRERNLKVETADAVVYMEGLPESSLCVVSGFHIAEHLPFGVLQQLVQQALRVLVPGGLLILETPNPENIAVGTSSFYLDPTHQRPIPPDLLSFLPEHYGFARFRLMRLQESAHLHGDAQVGLLDVLNGVSPDYAVVAQKQGEPLLMEALTPAFVQSHGLTLHDLAHRHEHALDMRLMALEAKAQQAQEQAVQAEAKAQQAQEQAVQAEAKAQQAQEQATRAEIKAQKAESIGQHYIPTLNAVYASKSWRWTAPLRWVFGQARRVKNEGLKSRIKAFIKKATRKINHELLLRPSLRQKLIGVSRRLGIHASLKTLLRKAQGHPASSTYLSFVKDGGLNQPNLENLSPRARQIYADLKKAVEEKNQQGNC